MSNRLYLGPISRRATGLVGVARTFPVTLAHPRLLHGRLRFGVRVAGAATCNFLASAVDSVNRTTYTFTGFTATAGTKKLVVAMDADGAGSGQTVSSVKVHVPNVAGDAAGTALSGIGSLVTDSEAMCQIFQLNSFSGTGFEITVTFSASKGNCGVGVYEVFNAATVAGTPGTSTANPSSASIDIPANGVAIAARNEPHLYVDEPDRTL
jgi:hypothetical protein